MSPSTNATKKLIAERIRENRDALHAWAKRHAEAAPPPFYCSVDLRDSGYKIAPVDSNLFPAGFNNICPEDLRAAPEVLRRHLEQIAKALKISTPTKILIVPESHTTNLYYIENLYYLLQIIRDAGFEAELGWYGAGVGHSAQESIEKVELTSATDKKLVAHPLKLDDGILSAGGFVPDLVILNNDFSGGYPRVLDQVKQPVVPSHALGWHSRKKSRHFVHYNELAREFAEIAGLDPWLIQIDTEEVGPVNFNEEQGTEEVALAVERVLARTQQAYENHSVKRKPFAFVKNNAGTYGIGIMVAHSADELRKMNRRTKNKMSVGKNKAPIESVVIQEGVPTATLVDRLPAEPVIYLFGQELVGGFLRTNTEKGDEDNLNSQGMVFRKLCMSDLQRSLDEPEEVKEPMLELVYGWIARISALASGQELADLRKAGH